MRRRRLGGKSRGQPAPLAEARAGYLSLDWPEPVHEASKGYVGVGGSWRFVWRTSLECVATVSALPGLAHWSARSVLYVGRSDREFIAIQRRPRWHSFKSDVHEVWRAPLDTAVVTERTFGSYALVLFGGHPAWVLTTEVESLLGAAPYGGVSAR